MLIQPNIHGFSVDKKYVVGRGFVDTLSSMIRSISGAFKNVAGPIVGPVVKSIGAYAHANKDLIAKPVLGAIGSLAATGLTSGIPAIIKRVAGRKRKAKPTNATSDTTLDAASTIPEGAKFKEILKSISGSEAQLAREAAQRPVSDILGSGVSTAGYNRSGPHPIRECIAKVKGRSNRIIKGSGIKRF